MLSVPFPTQFAYDEEGRLLWLRDRRGKAAEMCYDEAGRLAWLNHGQTTCSGSSTAQSIGPTTTWTYDDRDRIRSVTHRGPPPGVGIPGPVLLSRTYERNDADEPRKITHEDGRYTEIDYDPAGRVEEERYFDSVGVLQETITYGYDLDGNRTSRTSNAGIEVYEYDTGSRLTRVTLDGVETQRFEYDENGRVNRIVRDGLDQRLTWDALDRLTRVEDFNAQQNPAAFDYDGQGRRVGRDNGAFQYVLGPTGNQGLESPHLVHNGLFLTGELVYNGEHALWRYDGNEPPDTRLYLRDAMGSVIGLMDAQGNLVESFEYDAFGNARGPGGEALPANLGGDSRFQGMWKDTGTGLYYVRARYYDSRTGRFLSRDPVEGDVFVPETLMPYAFASNNPHVFRDPEGLYSLAELNVSQNVQRQLNSAAINASRQLARSVIQGAKAQIKDIAVDQFQELMSEILLGLVPGEWKAGELILKGRQAGEEFEELVEDGICGVFRIPDVLWLSVPLNKATGRPSLNGISCSERDRTRGGARRRGVSGRSVVFPDFLVAQYEPVRLNGSSRRSALVGDIKLSGRNIDPRRNQFKTMLKHARNFQYVPVVAYLTLRKPTEALRRRIQSKAKDVAVFFASVFD